MRLLCSHTVGYLPIFELVVGHKGMNKQKSHTVAQGQKERGTHLSKVEFVAPSFPGAALRTYCQKANELASHGMRVDKSRTAEMQENIL